LDLVELRLHLSGEADLEGVGEAAPHHLPHLFAERRGREAPFFGGRVPAALQRADDGGVRRRPADALLFQGLHEARLAVAWGRLSEMLGRNDLPQRGAVALVERRNRPEVVAALGVLGFVALVEQNAIAVEQHYGAGR